MESSYLAHVAARVARQHEFRGDDLQDLLQELRIALWEVGLDVRVSAGWLFQVANHKAVDLLRRRIRRRKRERAFAERNSSSVLDLELDHLLHARVGRFPPSLRTFYGLRYLEGLSQREIARRMGLCRSSVRWLDRRCRQRLAG